MCSNRDYSILIQFDLKLSHSPKYLFTEFDINEILNNITKNNREKQFCWDFFIKNSILTLADSYTFTWYYNLEKMMPYKPYPNHSKIIELIKLDLAIELDFINLTIN